MYELIVGKERIDNYLLASNNKEKDRLGLSRRRMKCLNKDKKKIPISQLPKQQTLEDAWPTEYCLVCCFAFGKHGTNNTFYFNVDKSGLSSILDGQRYSSFFWFIVEDHSELDVFLIELALLLDTTLEGLHENMGIVRCSADVRINYRNFLRPLRILEANNSIDTVSRGFHADNKLKAYSRYSNEFSVLYNQAKLRIFDEGIAKLDTALIRSTMKPQRKTDDTAIFSTFEQDFFQVSQTLVSLAEIRLADLIPTIRTKMIEETNRIYVFAAGIAISKIDDLFDLKTDHTYRTEENVPIAAEKNSRGFFYLSSTRSALTKAKTALDLIVDIHGDCMNNKKLDLSEDTGREVYSRVDQSVIVDLHANPNAGGTTNLREKLTPLLTSGLHSIQKDTKSQCQ